MTIDKSKTYVIATRGSKLALWQTHHVQGLLAKAGIKTEVNIIKTTGDKVQNRFLHEMGGKGLFVRELETAMLEGQADLAVHSLKDLPAKIPESFVLGAILQRHSPFDVVILGNKAKIPKTQGFLTKDELADLGSMTLATASLRRQSLLRSASSKLIPQPIRGNVDTRIDKLKASAWDGIILAKAAIERLNLNSLPMRVLDPAWFVPSPAQGALAIECREDHPLRSVLETLDDPATRQAVTIERGVLEALGGDCTMPIGCFVFPDGGQTFCHAKVLDYEGGSAEARCSFRQRLEVIDRVECQERILEGLQAKGLEGILAALKTQKPNLGDLAE